MKKRCKDPWFEEVWHAQLFAMTVHLNERGNFTWQDWMDNFNMVLHVRGLENSQNGGNDYFVAWLDALESFLSQKGIADLGDLSNLQRELQGAYLAAPHGSLVNVKQKR